MWWKKGGMFFGSLCMVTYVVAIYSTSQPDYQFPALKKPSVPNMFAHKSWYASGSSFRYYLKTFFKDIIQLNLNLISFDTYKIFTTTFPFFIAARMVDYNIHANFYCKTHHRNLNQMPCWCDNVARFGLAIPIVGLGSLAFFAKDQELRTTSWVFILGMPFLIFGNKITKKITFEACYRPWNEHFSCVKRAAGGFPSGHAAYVTYMTVLYGLRYGLPWAVPLGLYGAFVTINFCVSNRHYLSQLVAGVGFGTMYAFAANRLIESKLIQYDYLYCGLDSQGSPGIGVRYRF
jgi:membrane-associated phospholipid phosphatase